jgi:hypothetical protein
MPKLPYAIRKKTWQAPAITGTGTIDHQRLRFLDALLRMFGNTLTWQFVTTGDGRLNILMESDTRRASLSLCLDM